RKAVLDGEWTSDKLELKTENIRSFRFLQPSQFEELYGAQRKHPDVVIVDGQRVERPAKGMLADLVKENGKWHAIKIEFNDPARKPEKKPLVQGPIDDMFMDDFSTVSPERAGWNPVTDRYTRSVQDRFTKEWDRWMRGTVQTVPSDEAIKHPRN